MSISFSWVSFLLKLHLSVKILHARITWKHCYYWKVPWKFFLLFLFLPKLNCLIDEIEPFQNGSTFVFSQVTLYCFRFFKKCRCVILSLFVFFLLVALFINANYWTYNSNIYSDCNPDSSHYIFSRNLARILNFVKTRNNFIASIRSE